MWSLVSNEIKTSTSRRGKRRLHGVALMLANELIKTHSRSGRATLKDADLAAIISDETHVDISAATARRLRLKLNISAVRRGGARPGAGRPPVDVVPQPRPRRQPPRISDEALAAWCATVYEYEPHQPGRRARLVPRWQGRRISDLPVVRARLIRGQKGV